jgi:hypothetical protein
LNKSLRGVTDGVQGACIPGKAYGQELYQAFVSFWP